LINDKLGRSVLVLSVLIFGLAAGHARADDNQPTPHRDSLLTAARAIMDTAHYCALITLDDSGYPHARTMDPFAPEDDMTIWLGTKRDSRKVREVHQNPRVALYYPDPAATGYVMIKGNAELVDDPALMEKYWKEKWEAFYKDKANDYLLIMVIPMKLEILSYRHGLAGDPVDWTPPSVEFSQEEKK
jgi:general stress protein 26